MNSIQKFHSEPFIDALKAFFKELNVPYNSISEIGTNPEKVIGEKKCNNIISELFPFGLVTDEIFGNTIHNISQNDLKTEKYQGILLFGVLLSNTNPTRSDLAEITRQINREFPYTPVVVVFKYDHFISFANAERIDYKQQWHEGEKIGKVSMLKDIEVDKPHRAHQDILAELGKHRANSFEELYQAWQKTLNTKELNNRFYKDLFNWYLYAKDHAKFHNEIPNEQIIAWFKDVFEFINDEANIPLEIIDNNEHEDGGINFYISCIGPLGGQGNNKNVKVDISRSEQLVFKPLMNEVLIGYSDLEEHQLLCYPLEEVLVEKMRSVMQRMQARDFYDIWYLLEVHEMEADYYVSEFEAKCKSKDLIHTDFPKKLDERLPQYKGRWKSSMSEQIKDLPDFDQVEREVQRHLKKLKF